MESVFRPNLINNRLAVSIRNGTNIFPMLSTHTRKRRRTIFDNRPQSESPSPLRHVIDKLANILESYLVASLTLNMKPSDDSSVVARALKALNGGNPSDLLSLRTRVAIAFDALADLATIFSHDCDAVSVVDWQSASSTLKHLAFKLDKTV